MVMPFNDLDNLREFAVKKYKFKNILCLGSGGWKMEIEILTTATLEEVRETAEDEGDLS